MIYLLERYIITDLGKELHVTDLVTGESFKRVKIANDFELIKQAQKII